MKADGDVQDALAQIGERLSSIEATLAARCNAESHRISRLEQTTQRAHERIDGIQTAAARTSGILATIVSVVIAGLSWILKK